MIKGWSQITSPKRLWMHKEYDPFTKNDEDTLAAFCGQAAIALENARLYERMHDQPHFEVDILKGVDMRAACILVHNRVKEICNCEAARLIFQLESSESE